ncbi:F-box domain-containing protein [Fusarium sp. Ph1]|nr:F-box domain-containing protein [Fusarium sp. Ph1]
MALDLLPTELQCSFIRLLDPIGLISLSQTSQHFRLLIKPTTGHFVQRLLQMETLEEYGGPMPFLALYTVHSEPLADECNDVRWACTSCRRLLVRRCFGNIFIQEPPYQKLMRDSPLYDAPTTWEPVADMVHKPTIEEDVFIGSDRRNRRCLECQYRRGELGPPSHEADGTARVPVQESRRVLFDSELDRYFPGLSDFLGHQIPKAPETMYLDDDISQAAQYDLSPGKCGWCVALVPIRRSERDNFPYLWDDLEFREKVEALLKGACCNACFAKANGRLELGHALGSRLRTLIDRALQEVSSKLKEHARIFEWNTVFPEMGKLEQHLQEVEAAMSCFDVKYKVLHEKDIADLKGYRTYAINVRDQIYKDEISPTERDSSELGAWAGGHKLCEDILEDLKTCRKVSEESPEAFAAWALDRDESTWDYEVEAALSREIWRFPLHRR